MGTSGDKIVLLDGMGSGSGSAANGLLSMIPGMFTSLLGGNKMDPNLVAGLTAGGCGSSSYSGYGADVVSGMVLVVMEMIVALTVFRLN
jgi:hypothetical protein